MQMIVMIITFLCEELDLLVYLDVQRTPESEFCLAALDLRNGLRNLSDVFVLDCYHCLTCFMSSPQNRIRP